MIAEIADVVFRSRKVEIPDNCEHCGHPLKNNLIVHRYDYYLYTGDHKGEPVDDVEGTDFPGEGPPLGFACSECGEMVAFGKERVLRAHDMEQVVEDTVWSQTIGRVIFDQPAVLLEPLDTGEIEM